MRGMMLGDKMSSNLILASNLIFCGLVVACSDQSFTSGGNKLGVKKLNPSNDGKTEIPAISSGDGILSEDSASVELKKCSREYQIPGSANPYFSGSPITAKLVYNFSKGNNTDTGANSAPVQIVPTNPACLNGGSKLTFSTSGSLSHGGGTALSHSPEGNGRISGHALGAALGKSDLLAPLISIVGVFVGEGDPASSMPPPRLDFTSSEQRNYIILEPRLNQLFFVGDGKTDGGVIQKIVVPDGTQRLYLATWDIGQWNNNTGSMMGSIKLVQ